MKRFISKVAFFLCFCLSVTVLSSYAADPYNVFHWGNIRNNGVEPNKNYIKTKYILAHPDKYDGLLFGSSRVGSIHTENIPGLNVYNMTYSSGTPKEHYETLKTLIEGGVKPNTVYMGVDSSSYTEDPESHNTKGLNASYQYLKSPVNFARLYLDPSLTMQSLFTILGGGATVGYDEFYTYGWWCDYGTETAVDWSTAVPAVNEGCFRMEETLREIESMVRLCVDNEIRLVVFTNPMCEITYNESIENYDYAVFLRRLAGVTDYYNFSGLNSVTIDTDNFIDSSHYSAEVGDMLIDAMCGGAIDETLNSQGFGWYVTSSNVDGLLENLNIL